MAAPAVALFRCPDCGRIHDAMGWLMCQDLALKPSDGPMEQWPEKHGGGSSFREHRMPFDKDENNQRLKRKLTRLKQDNVAEPKPVKWPKPTWLSDPDVVKRRTLTRLRERAREDQVKQELSRDVPRGTLREARRQALARPRARPEGPVWGRRRIRPSPG